MRPSLVDRLLLRLERLRVDHRAHEVLEVGDVAHLDLRDLLREPLAELRPEICRRIDPRGRRALLPLVLERAAHDRRRNRVDVRGRVGDDEVLAAGLADDPRVVAVVADVRADRLPHRVEDARRAGEVNACEVFAREGGVSDRRARSVDEVDHAGRQARFDQELHQEVRGVGRGSGRLPDDRVPHQRRARRQVRADRGEVERRDGEDEALERPVLHPVPHALARDRLLLVDPRHELDVEAVEVDHLAGRVDLGLVRGLRLAEHRRGVERRAPRAGQELGCAQEDCGALLPGETRPVLPGLGGCADRLVDLRLPALVGIGEDVALLVRHHDLGRRAGRDVLTADHERQLDALGLHLVEPAAQLLPFGRARARTP